MAEAADRRHAIIGTAGHIDHGKTALVRALTGVDADTLAEEKRRGITIELGFVFMDTPDPARQVVFIDVPGHERLVRTMVAGAANLDGVLLVIAADEGPMPQTREHLDILQLLGVERGIVALNKADLADPDRRAEAEAEVRALTAGTFLAAAPLIPVSALTGEGVEDLRAALLALAAQAAARPDSGLFRMPVDRVFTMPGFGTIVAGTVLSGAVAVGDTVEVLPDGLTARVRKVQVHHGEVPGSRLGQRTALNLPDLTKQQLRRGQCLAAPGSLRATERMDAQLQLLRAAPAEVKHRARLRLHVGTAEVICRVVLLDRDVLHPGESAPAQFLLEAPSVAVRGDRFVVRSFSPVLTLGGGVILEPYAGPHRRRSEGTLEDLAQLAQGATAAAEQRFRLTESRALGPPEVARELGENVETIAAAIEDLVEQGRLLPVGTTRGEATPSSARYVHVEVLTRLRERALTALRDYFRRHPYRVFMPAAELRSQLAKVHDRVLYEALLADLEAAQVLYRQGPRVALCGREPELSREEQALVASMERRFREGGLAPPLEAEVRAELGVPPPHWEQLMTALLEQDRLVRVAEKVTYHTEPLHQALEQVTALLRERGRLTVAELRDALGVSRKYALALLEHTDQIGLTRREGDYRYLRQAGG